MTPLPSSVLVAGLFFLASALYGLITGSAGLELYELGLPTSLTVTMALIHVYAGLGLIAGSNFARVLALWLLGLGFTMAWVSLWGFVRDGAPFGDYASCAVRLSVVCYFLWHLSGGGAMEYSGNHGDHGGHGDEAAHGAH